MSKTDWSEWLHVPNVRLWQACALSLGMDPHNLRADRYGWMDGSGNGPHFDADGFPDDEVFAEFKKRVRVLAANLHEGAYFSARGISMDGSANSLVCLAEVAKWATQEVGWTVPPELAELSARVKPRESRMTAVAPGNASNPNRSDKLQLLLQASDHFWRNTDREDRSTHRTNKEVAAWFEERDFSPSMAETAAAIIRPEWVPVGRKPDK